MQIYRADVTNFNYQEIGVGLIETVLQHFRQLVLDKVCRCAKKLIAPSATSKNQMNPFDYFLFFAMLYFMARV